MYGDHIIATPAQRWGILVTYWSALSGFVVPYGYLSALMAQEWKPLNSLYVFNMIVSLGIFLSLWTFSAYSFRRQFSFFSTIVYPIGHTIDTMFWFLVFDVGKSRFSSEASSMMAQYIAGHTLMSIWIIFHRRTFELWYLPEHHPPGHVRGNLWYVAAAGVTGFCFSSIYHWYGDLRWCVLVKYIIDLYCCIRMRLPSPWMPYGNDHEKDTGWDWTGY